MRPTAGSNDNNEAIKEPNQRIDAVLSYNRGFFV